MKKIIAVLAAFVLFAQLSACADYTAGHPTGTAGTTIEEQDKGDPVNESNTAIVRVSDTVVNTVNPYIFGDNISWRGDGYFLWDKDTDAPDPDLLEKLRQTGITHLRYPGGIEGDYFNWYESVGKNRIEQIDPFSMDWPTNAVKSGERYYPCFGPDEFQQLCEDADIEATIQFNAGTGKPEDAGHWVKHCQDRGFKILFFSVGNEVNFEFEAVEGIRVTKTAEEYIDFYEKAYDSVRQVSKSAEVGGICLPLSHPLCYHRDWDARVLSALGDMLDFIDVHIGYSPYFVRGQSNDKVIASFMASSKWISGMLEETKEEIKRYAADQYDDIDIHIGEYGPISGGNYDNSIAGALFQASLFHVMLSEPKVTSANHLPVLNHYASPTLIGACREASLVGGEQVLWDNAGTHVFRMYADMIGRDVLKVEVEAPVFSASAVGLMPAIEDVRYIDAAAYDDHDNRILTLFVINKHQTENFLVKIDLPYEDVDILNIAELWNENPLAYNNWSNGEKVVPVQLNSASAKVADNLVSVDTKPISLLRIDVKY